jgi:hypothetical protein
VQLVQLLDSCGIQTDERREVTESGQPSTTSPGASDQSRRFVQHHPERDKLKPTRHRALGGRWSATGCSPEPGPLPDVVLVLLQTGYHPLQGVHGRSYRFTSLKAELKLYEELLASEQMLFSLPLYSTLKTALPYVLGHTCRPGGG